MKVKNLIEKLLKINGETEVCIRSANPEHPGTLVEITYVDTTPVQKRTMTFRDMMDGITYDKEVCVYEPSSKTKVVIIR